MFYKLGVFFQKAARFFFSRTPATCWNCGQKCGMNYTIARGFRWCEGCFARYRSYIYDSDYVFSVRHFGIVKRADPTNEPKPAE